MKPSKPYFSHDEGARNDPKLVEVLMTLGHEGKSVYWDLVEMLYEQGGYLMLSQCKGYAFALRTDCDLIKKLVSDFDLFVSDGTNFWSETCLERMGMRDAKKLARAEAGAKGGKIKAEREAVAKALLQQNPSNATAMPQQILAIKEKEMKVKTADAVTHEAAAANLASENEKLTAELAGLKAGLAATPDRPALPAKKTKGEMVVAQVAADGGETFTADTFKALNDPQTFADSLAYLGYTGIDFERYRLDIRGKVKAAGMDAPAGAFGKFIVSYMTREAAAGPLLPAPPPARVIGKMPDDPATLWGALNPDYDHRNYTHQPAGQYTGRVI